MEGPNKPSNLGKKNFDEYPTSPERSEDERDSSVDGVSLHSSETSIPKNDSKTPQQPIKNRPVAVSEADVQPISGRTKEYLNHFCATGSAHSFLSLLNDQQGLDGKFQIVFQPDDSGRPIPLNEFSHKGNEEIQAAYDKVSKQIAINSQSIAYGLMEKMAERQQRMFEELMQQQRAEFQNQMHALLQVMMYPVIQPMPVPFNYLTSFAGSIAPQQPAAIMGWGGIQGAMPPTPLWAPYPQPMIALQPALQQPFNYPPLQSGFNAVPVSPPQVGTGLQTPFSPVGYALQQQPQGLGARLGYLPQFCQSPPQSFIPPWAYSSFAPQGRENPVVINNLNQPPVSPAGTSQGAAPVINIKVNPVFNNNPYAPGTRDYKGSEGTPDYDAGSRRDKDEEWPRMPSSNRGDEADGDVELDVLSSYSDDAPLIIRSTKPLKPRYAERGSGDEISRLMDEIKSLRQVLENVESPEDLADLIKQLKDALNKNDLLTKENLTLKNQNNKLEGLVDDLDDTIKNLKEGAGSNKKLARQLEQLKKDLHHKDDQLREQKILIESQSDEINRLRKNVGDKKREIKDLKQKNIDVENERKQREKVLKEEISSLGGRLRSAGRDIEELSRELDNKKQELLDLQNRYDEQISSYKSRLTQLGKEKDNAIGELNSKLEDQKNKSEKKISTLEKEIDGLEYERDKKDRKIKDLLKEIDRLKPLDGSNGDQQDEIDTLEKEVRKLKRQVEAGVQEIESLNKELENERSRNSQLNNTIDSLQKELGGEINKYQKELEGLQDLLAEQKDQIDRQKKAIEDLQNNPDGKADPSAIQVMQEDLGRLQRESDDTKAKYEAELGTLKSDLERERAEAKAREKDLNDQRKAVEGKIGLLTTEVSDLNEGINDLRECLRLSNANNSKEPLESKIEKLEKQRDEKQDELSNLEKKLNDLHAQLENADADNRKLKNDLEGLSKNLEDELKQRGLLEENKRKNEELIAKLQDQLEVSEAAKNDKDGQIASKISKISQLEGGGARNADEISELKIVVSDLKSERENDKLKIRDLLEQLDGIKDEKNAAEEKAQQLQCEIKKLQADAQGQTDALNEKEQALERLTVAGEQGKSEFDKLQAEYDQLFAERAGNHQRIKELEGLLNAEVDKVAALEKKLKDRAEQHKEELEQAKEKAITAAEGFTNTIEQLKQQIDKQKDDIKAREGELKALTAQGATDGEAFIRLQDERDQLAEAKRQNEQRIEALETDLENARNKITALDDKLKTAEQTITELKEEREKTQEQHTQTLHAQEAAAKEQANELEEKIKKLQADAQGQTDALNEKEQALERLTVAGEQGKSEFDKLQAEYDQLFAERAGNHQRIKELEGLLNAEVEKVAALEKKLKDRAEQHKEELEQAKEKAITAAEGFTNTIEQLKEQIDKQKDDIKAREGELKALTAQGATDGEAFIRLQDERDQLAEAKRQNEQRIEALETDLENARNKITALDDKLKTAEQTITELKEEREKTQEQHTQTLHAQEAAAKEQANELEEKIKKLQADAQGQTDALNEKEQALERLTVAGEQGKSEFDKLQAEYDQLFAERAGNHQRIKELEGLLNAEVDKVAALEKKLKDRAEQHKEELEQAKEKATTAADGFTNTIEQLKEQIEKQKDDIKAREGELKALTAQGATDGEAFIRLQDERDQLAEAKRQNEQRIEALETDLENARNKITALDDKLKTAEQTITELKEEREKTQEQHTQTLHAQEAAAKEQANELEEKIKKLQAEAQGQTDVLNEKEQELVRLAETGEQGKEALEKLQAEHDQLLTEREGNHQRINKLEELLSAEMDKVAELEKQLKDRAEQHKEELEQEKEKAAAVAEGFTNTIEQLKEQIEKQKDDIKAREGELKALTAQGATDGEAFIRLQDERDQLAEAKRQNEQRIEALETDLENARNKITALDDKLKTAEQTITELKEEREKTQEQHTQTLHAQEAAAKEQANELEEKIKKLQAEAQGQTDVLNEKEQELVRLAETGEQGKEALEKLQAEHDQLLAEREGNHQRINKLEELLSAEMDKVAELEKQLKDRAEQHKEELEKRKAEAASTAQQLEDSLEKLRKEVSSKTDQLTAKEKELEKLTGNNEKAQEEKIRLEAECRQLKDELHNKARLIDESERKLKEAGGVIDKLKGELQSLRELQQKNMAQANTEAQKLRSKLQVAHEEKVKGVAENKKLNNLLLKARQQVSDFVQKDFSEYLGDKGKPLNEAINIALEKFVSLDFGIEEMGEEVEKFMKMIAFSRQSLDKACFVKETYENKLNTPQKAIDPESLEGDVITGKERLEREVELDKHCLKNLSDIVQQVKDKAGELGISQAAEEFKDACFGFVYDEIERLKSIAENNLKERESAVSLIDSIEQKFADVDGDNHRVIETLALDKQKDIAGKINEKVIGVLRSDLSARAYEARESNRLCETTANSHRALSHLQTTLKSLVDGESLQLSGKGEAQSLKEVEEQRKLSENIRKGIERLKTKNLGELSELIDTDIRVYWDKYVDLAISKHKENVSKLEMGSNTPNIINRMMEIKEVSDSHKHILKKIGSVFVEGQESYRGIEKAKELLETNDEVLESVLSMVSRLQDSHGKGEGKIFKRKNGIYGNRKEDENRLIVAQSMLNTVLDRHGIAQRFTPAQMIIALADQASRVDSKAVEIASDRYNASRGWTQKLINSEKVLRSKKIIDQCFSHLGIELGNKGSLWRGLPVDKDNKLIEDPHRQELECFESGTIIRIPDWDNTTIKEGSKTGVLEKSGQGILDKFYSKRDGVEIKEHVAVGERFFSHNKSPVVFHQRKNESGDFGKITTDLNGSKRELSPKLYLTYPKYNSPFKKEDDRDGIPLASTLTGEVGELVQTCEQGQGKYSEYYYQVVNKGEFPESSPVLKCVPITTRNPLEEEFRGSVMGWLACSVDDDQKDSEEALSMQAWMAFKQLHKNKYDEKELQAQFKKVVLDMADDRYLQGRAWFVIGDFNKFKDEFEIPKETQEGASDKDQGGKRYLARDKMDKVGILLPDSLQIDQNRRERTRQVITKVNEKDFGSIDLPADFSYHFEEYINLLEKCLGPDHPKLGEMKELRQNEKNDFNKKVFYERYTLDGVLLKPSEEKAKSVTSQVKAMTKLARQQSEEVMGYVEDCAILERQVISMMPKIRKPCSIEDAKQYFGQYDMSELFAKTMMAYLAAESARDISKGLEREMKELLSDLKYLDFNCVPMPFPEYKKQCDLLNSKNFSIARRKMAMRKRLLDGVGTQNLDAQNIAAKKYENTKGTLFRDYQIDPARELLSAVSSMAQNSKSDDEKIREKHHRLVCQLGTGFGKTELTKMLMSQACLERMGAGYIGPGSNVKNYNQDLWRHTKAAGERFQPIDLKAMFVTTYTAADNWWKDLSNLEKIYNIIQGLPEEGGEGSDRSRIPWTMSTADLGVLLSLHAHMAKETKEHPNDDNRREVYAKLDKIISALSGSSRENKPLIIRDECDTFDDRDLIAEHCLSVIGKGASCDADTNQKLRLCYDCSIHNGIYLSASKDSDYVSLIRAEAGSLNQLTGASNKDVTTCELRAEQYLLKARWHLAKSNDLSETVKAALEAYESEPERGLVFCDPSYKKHGGCMQMAYDGMLALRETGSPRAENLKGHLYFKDGHYYCYSDKLDGYKEVKREQDGKIHSLGARLSEADEAEIRKTGGAGYITWMSETRGYTAAQNNEEPNPTAFIFRNISTLSTPEKQQLIGRDRNIDPYGQHDNLVVFSGDELNNQNDKNKIKFTSIRDEAGIKLSEYHKKRDNLSDNLNSDDAKQVMAVVDSDIPLKLKNKSASESEEDALRTSFELALNKQHILWKDSPAFSEHADKMYDLAIARWEAMNFIKNKALTAMSLEIDFSSDKIELENNAEIAARYGLVDGLLQQEIDFIHKDLVGKANSLHDGLTESITSVSPWNKEVPHGFAEKVTSKVIDDVGKALELIAKPVQLKETDNSNCSISECYKASDMCGEVSGAIDRTIAAIEGDQNYAIIIDGHALLPLENKRDKLYDEAKEQIVRFLNSINKLKGVLLEAKEGHKFHSDSQGMKDLTTCKENIETLKGEIESGNVDPLTIEENINHYAKDMLNALCKVKLTFTRGSLTKDIFKPVVSALHGFLDLNDGGMENGDSGSGIVRVGTVASEKKMLVFTHNKTTNKLDWSYHNNSKVGEFNLRTFKTNYALGNHQEKYKEMHNFDKSVKNAIKQYFKGGNSRKGAKDTLMDTLVDKTKSLEAYAKTLDGKLDNQAQIKINPPDLK